MVSKVGWKLLHPYRGFRARKPHYLAVKVSWKAARRIDFVIGASTTHLQHHVLVAHACAAVLGGLGPHQFHVYSRTIWTGSTVSCVRNIDLHVFLRRSKL
jgi:hypothetical protein